MKLMEDKFVFLKVENRLIVDWLQNPVSGFLALRVVDKEVNSTIVDKS